jgi:hypothetical protein
MNALLPFRTSIPRPRRPILGAVLMALSYAAPVLLVLLYNIVNSPEKFFAAKELQNTSTSSPEVSELFVLYAIVTLLFVALLAVVTLASRRLFKYGAAWRKLDAIELIKTNPRAPVLYLRSFNDDASVDYTGSVNPLGPRRTVEMRLAKALMSVGPVISIGHPGERLPELGANRFYVSDAD